MTYDRAIDYRLETWGALNAFGRALEALKSAVESKQSCRALGVFRGACPRHRRRCALPQDALARGYAVRVHIENTLPALMRDLGKTAETQAIEAALQTPDVALTNLSSYEHEPQALAR